MTNTQRTVGIVACIVIILLLLIFLLPPAIDRSFPADAPPLAIQTEAREPGPTRAEAAYIAYIGSKKSKKFHLPDCSYLPDQPNQIPFDSRDEAIAAGYKPCGHCNP